MNAICCKITYVLNDQHHIAVHKVVDIAEKKRNYETLCYRSGRIRHGLSVAEEVGIALEIKKSAADCSSFFYFIFPPRIVDNSDL